MRCRSNSRLILYVVIQAEALTKIGTHEHRELCRPPRLDNTIVITCSKDEDGSGNINPEISISSLETKESVNSFHRCIMLRKMKRQHNTNISMGSRDKFPLWNCRFQQIIYVLYAILNHNST
jgi:hypothetical protein